MISWRYFPPMAFTAAAMFSGFFSIIQAANGHYLAAAQMIMLSMILDGFDGNVARLLKAQSKFGGEFDTYVDILSFGIAPAFLAYKTGLHEYGVWGLILASAIIFSGMTRLSRFRLVDPFRGQKGFLGLPITVNAGWIALTTYIIESKFTFLDFVLDREDFTHGPVAVTLWGCVTLLILLQVSTFRYQKPSKSWLFFVPSTIMVAMLLVDPEEFGPVVALIMSVYALYFAFISFWLPKLWQDEDAQAPAVAPVDIGEDDSVPAKKH